MSGPNIQCDEMGMPLARKPPKVVAHASRKHQYAVTSADKSQITVLACASASGYTILPMVIFNGKHLQMERKIGEVPGTFYGLSDSVWMDSVLYEEWFTNHFVVVCTCLCLCGTPFGHLEIVIMICNLK